MEFFHDKISEDEDLHENAPDVDDDEEVHDDDEEERSDNDKDLLEDTPDVDDDEELPDIDFAVEGLSFVLANADYVAQVDEHNIVSLLEISDMSSLLHFFVNDAKCEDDSLSKADTAEGGDDSMSDADGWDGSESG